VGKTQRQTDLLETTRCEVRGRWGKDRKKGARTVVLQNNQVRVSGQKKQAGNEQESTKTLRNRRKGRSGGGR